MIPSCTILLTFSTVLSRTRCFLWITHKHDLDHFLHPIWQRAQDKTWRGLDQPSANHIQADQSDLFLPGSYSSTSAASLPCGRQRCRALFKILPGQNNNSHLALCFCSSFHVEMPFWSERNAAVPSIRANLFSGSKAFHSHILYFFFIFNGF